MKKKEDAEKKKCEVKEEEKDKKEWKRKIGWIQRQKEKREEGRSEEG